MEVSKESLIDVRLLIIQEYQEGILGYKKLAKKYGLTRDQVRGVVKSKNISLGKNKEKYMQVPKFKNIEEELEYYRTGMLFWRTHAMNLEEESNIQEDKKAEKKSVSTPSSSANKITRRTTRVKK